MKKRLAALLLTLALALTMTVPAMAAQSEAALPTSHAVYVNGLRLSTIPVYNIEGSNYFKLRDVANYVGFSCSWNGVKGCIEVDTALPYDGTQVSTSAAVAQKSAELSGQPLYVDGTLQTDCTVYNIEGNNFFKLRDLARMMNFGCIWNREKGCVEISTVYGYSPDNVWGEASDRVQPGTEKPEGQQPAAVTEESVYNSIIALKSRYPEGMHYTNDDYYFFEAANMHCYGCVAFAAICSDTAFGTGAPVSTHEDFDSIKTGDIIRSGYHSFVVLSHSSGSITIAEGNYNSSIHWGRTINRASLESKGFAVTTRY